MGGITYSVQFTTLDKETLQSYYDNYALKLRQDAMKLFPNKFVAFRTELEVIGEY